MSLCQTVNMCGFHTQLLVLTLKQEQFVKSSQGHTARVSIRLLLHTLNFLWVDKALESQSQQLNACISVNDFVYHFRTQAVKKMLLGDCLDAPDIYKYIYFHYSALVPKTPSCVCDGDYIFRPVNR